MIQTSITNKFVAIALAVLLALGSAAYFHHSFMAHISPNGIAGVVQVPRLSGMVSTSTMYFYASSAASSTLSVPSFSPDLELGSARDRLIAPDLEGEKSVAPWKASSWVFVEKEGVIHAELAYGVTYLDASQAGKIPELIPGAVIYTDTYGQARKLFLSDAATVAGIADPRTLHFVKGSDAYLADSRAVYYLKSDWSRPGFDPRIFSFQMIPGADPLTFGMLLKSQLRSEIAIDSKSVYEKGQARADIDRATFRTLKEDYSFRDKNDIYVISGPVTSTGVEWALEKHPLTSIERNIGANTLLFSTDGTSVYFNANALDVLYNNKPPERRIVPGADPKTFVMLAGFLDYYNNAKQDGTVAQYAYGRDQDKIYYRDIQIVGADPGTFLPIENGGYVHSYAMDKSSAYYMDKRIPGSDPETFEILWQYPKEGCIGGSYSKDKSHVYFKDVPIVGADPKTFNVLIGDESYAIDGIHVYKAGDVLPGADPKAFVSMCSYG